MKQRELCSVNHCSVVNCRRLLWTITFIVALIMRNVSAFKCLRAKVPTKAISRHCQIGVSRACRPVAAASSTTTTAAASTSPSCSKPSTDNDMLQRIPQSVWRQEARNHQQRIYELLRPGLTAVSDPLNSGKQRLQSRTKKSSDVTTAATTESGSVMSAPSASIGAVAKESTTSSSISSSTLPLWTALDPQHPVYNFLIEYYGLKGIKGVKRLARWSPSFFGQTLYDPPKDEGSGKSKSCKGGILLEGATADDLSNALLHLRGATLRTDGIFYNPSTFFDSTRLDDNDNDETSKLSSHDKHDKLQYDAMLARAATPYLWYRAVLQQTLTAEPVLYCHGLHEWAMQYHPFTDASTPPASAKYQAHLRLRVDRTVINDVVERRGVHCTHVDALRYFSPAAAPLNHHGAVLHRLDQLRLEQPACVHAHMDLLKIALRLEPFLDASLLQRVLQIALQARTLDVAASPYDADTLYGVGVVPVETEEGRVEYRARQTELMQMAEPVRRDLLRAYDAFLSSAFTPHILSLADASPSKERFAVAEPGGLPWRKNLVD